MTESAQRSMFAEWLRRPTPAYLRALVAGGAPQSRQPNPNTVGDLRRYESEDFELIIEEGRRQLDEQVASYRDVQSRAQTLITVTLIVLAFNTAVFARLRDGVGWPGRLAPLVWGASIVLVLLGLLLAAAVVSVRGVFMAIDTTKTTNEPKPLLPVLAADYAESVRLGAQTVADRVNAFHIATRYTVWGATFTAGAFMLTA